MERTLRLPERTEDVWHGYINEVAPGQLYVGLSRHGPYSHAPRDIESTHNKLARTLRQANSRTAGVERLRISLFDRKPARKICSFDRRDKTRHAQGYWSTKPSRAPRKSFARPTSRVEDTIIF